MQVFGSFDEGAGFLQKKILVQNYELDDKVHRLILNFALIVTLNFDFLN